MNTHNIKKRTLRKISREKNAFSLTELLVIIGILAILAALLFPGLTTIRHSLDQASCAHNLRTIAQAAAAYSAENDGRLHPADLKVLNPYMGVPHTNNAFPVNKIWFCPADPRVREQNWLNQPCHVTRSSYAYNARVIGLPTEPNPRFGGQCWEKALRLPTEISRPSQVIHFITASSYYCRPQNKNAAFYHRGGQIANILYFDGSVRPYDAGKPDSAKRAQRLNELYQVSNWE
jgi:prepilin-type processing-associated H-X9-DG protein